MSGWILTSHYLNHTASRMLPGNIINGELILTPPLPPDQQPGQELWAHRGSRTAGESCPGTEPLRENSITGLVSRGTVPRRQLDLWRGDGCAG